MVLFTVYVEKILVPTLTNGDVVFLDNLGSHKGQAARNAVRQAAHMIFLPPHSPDLNPIEQLFAKLHYHLRKHNRGLWMRHGKGWGKSSTS